MNLLLDLDHTVSDAAWRDHMINEDGWDNYHLQLIHDKPIPEIIAMARGLYNSGWRIIGLTARPERFRRLSMNWLIRNKVALDELLMRPDDDYRSSPVVKLDLIYRRCPDIGDKRKFLLVDDREDICQFFVEAGFSTLQVKRPTREE